VLVEGKEENDFKITKEQLADAITPDTKAVIINSPSNRTGMMYSKEEVALLGEGCLERDTLILSDDIYEKLIYVDNPHVSIEYICEALTKQTVVINGVSTAHAMTGWRIGYAAGPKEIMQAMTKLASQSTSNPTTIAPYAAVEAYQNKTENENTAAQMKATV